jgi:flagellar hook-length control protein FliK
VSGSATAPLAIAAAAIAASTVATSAVAAASAQINTSTNTDATATAAASATASDAVASATAQVQTATSKAAATPVVQPTAPTPATPATTAADVALASTVATKTPVAPKATLKASVTAPAGTTAPADPDATPVPSDPSASAGTITANLAQQLAAAGKQPTADGVADAANTSDLTGVATATIATASPHEHSPAAGVGSISTGALDASAQLANPIQPQLQSAAATATPVAALGVTAATTGAVPLSGLAMEIAVSAQSGKSRFEIRLDPADLGRIDVRIDVDSNGQVTSHLTVEKPATLSMLQQDAPQLQRALNDAGLTTGNDGLQFSLRDQSSSGQNDGSASGRNAQRLIISDENIIPAAVAGQTYGRMLGSSSGVDIRV